jgi:dolichol-phosphate mannosyltransferase
VLSAARGARIAELVVNHRPRRFGRSKYGLSRAMRVLLDLLSIKFVSQFSHRPIQYFGLFALAALAIAAVFGSIGLLGLPEGFPDGRVLLNEWQMVIVSVLAVLFSAVVYFARLGLLAELAVKASGMHRRSTLDQILSELH